MPWTEPACCAVRPAAFTVLAFECKVDTFRWQLHHVLLLPCTGINTSSASHYSIRRQLRQPHVIDQMTLTAILYTINKFLQKNPRRRTKLINAYVRQYGLSVDRRTDKNQLKEEAGGSTCSAMCPTGRSAAQESVGNPDNKAGKTHYRKHKSGNAEHPEHPASNISCKPGAEYERQHPHCAHDKCKSYAQHKLAYRLQILETCSDGHTCLPLVVYAHPFAAATFAEVRMNDATSCM